MLSARDNQFLKEINMLKDLIDAEMLRQLKDVKEGKEITTTYGKMTVDDYKEKMDIINSVIRAVNDKDYSLLRSELPLIEKFIYEIKVVYSGFKETMDELAKRVIADPYEINPPRLKTHSFYKDKAEGNLEELLRKIENKLEKYKEIEPETNLEEIKIKDNKYRKYVKYFSMVDMILSALGTNDDSFLQGTVVDNIGELILETKNEFPEYLNDILWVANIFANKSLVEDIIAKYNFPFTLKSLENEICRPYQEMTKCFEKCLEEYCKTDEPSDILKERINDLRVVLHYLDFAIS